MVLLWAAAPLRPLLDQCAHGATRIPHVCMLDTAEGLRLTGDADADRMIRAKAVAASTKLRREDMGVAKGRTTAEVATGLSAVTLARAGSGVTVICPFPVLRADDPTLTIRPFLPRFVYRTSFAVSTVRPLTKTARAFMRHVKMSIRSDPAWHGIVSERSTRPVLEDSV